MKLLNTLQGLIFVYFCGTLAFGTWVLRGYFEAIPVEFEEAAMVDGCSKLSALFRVVLPAALPGIIAVGLITFMSCWGEFTMAMTYVTKKDYLTLPAGIYFFIKQEFADWGALMAMSTFACIPSLIVFLFFQKYLEKGITAGALKI